MSVILVLGVGTLSYKASSNLIDKQMVTYSESILQQVKERTDEMRDQVMKVSIPIIIKPSIQDNELQNLDLIEFTNTKYDIDSQLALSMFLKKFICSIYICNENGTVISSEYVKEAEKSQIRNFETYKNALRNGTKPIWTNVHENEFLSDKNKYVFSFARTMYDKETFVPFGVLILNVPASVLENICGNSNSSIYIVDGQHATFIFRVVVHKRVSACKAVYFCFGIKNDHNYLLRREIR